MTCDDSRAQRFAKVWWGASLATLVGIGSSAELAAAPIVAADVQLPGPILIQQSGEPQGDVGPPAGTPSEPAAGPNKPDSFVELHEALTAARERLEELSRAAEAVAATGQLQQELAALRQQNEQLQAEVAAARAERAELEQAKQAAEAHAAELTKAVEQATARAQEVDQELVAVRWQNAQLNTSLAQARTARDQMEAEAEQTQEALRTRVEELESGSGQTTAELARLRAQVGASEQRVADAESARDEAQARLSEMRDSVEQGAQDKARLGDDLTRVEGELATAKEQLAAAGQERAQMAQRNAILEDEREQLRTRLAAATEQLERSQAANARLEGEAAKLREAAGAATDVARQNLIAVENRIKELNEALAAVGPAAGTLETDPALLPESGAATATGQAAVEAPAAAAAKVAAVAADQAAAPSGAETDLARIKSASALHQPDDGQAAVMLAGLPLEKRLHVQGLLADLDGELDERGLMTTVPGELLFAVDSDEVQAGAYDTLAKVAELIGTYDDRQVLIIGHSDAAGDAAYNQQLSERRAELVKHFLVDNFEIDGARVATEGLGERRPIASNATLQGRRANRRVEVLILN
jgi:outer membrane protein OmpA-like peptidoglycan-associated protein/predicted nuclease with TOPRIM domain